MENPDPNHPEWFKPYEAAMQKLMKIPGVKSVGLGLKEKGGDVVHLWVLRVYVEQKKPLNELKPEELIPSEIDGIPTDVLVQGTEKPDGSMDTPMIQAGGGVMRKSHPDGVGGTAGPIVFKNGNELHVVSNRHVFVDHQALDGNYDMYAPEYSSCRAVAGTVIPNAGLRANYVFNGKTYYIDCAIARTNDGAQKSNMIAGIGELRPGIRDLSAEALAADGHTPATPIVVTKRGIYTDLTVGTVVELCSTSGGTTVWKLKYRGTAGSAYNYDVTYKIDASEPTPIATIIASFNNCPVTATLVGNAADRTIRFQGVLFAYHGDSGSPVCDNNRKVVALHYSSDYGTYKVNDGGSVYSQDISRGYHFGAHAAACWDKLGIDPNTGILSASSNSSGELLAVPGVEAVPLVVPKPLHLQIKENDFYKTAAGKILLDTFHRHSKELIDLVHHNREVKVAWHRMKGPGWTVVMLEGLKNGDSPLPSELDGISLSTAMKRLLDALLLHATDPLARDLQYHVPALMEVFRDAPAFNTVLQRLAERHVVKN